MKKRIRFFMRNKITAALFSIGLITALVATNMAGILSDGIVYADEPPIMFPDGVILENDGHGTASASADYGDSAAVVILSATPDQGYVFSSWEVLDGDVNIRENMFIMPNSDVRIKAHFELEDPEQDPKSDNKDSDPEKTVPDPDHTEPAAGGDDDWIPPQDNGDPEDPGEHDAGETFAEKTNRVLNDSLTVLNSTVADQTKINELIADGITIEADTNISFGKATYEKIDELSKAGIKVTINYRNNGVDKTVTVPANCTMLTVELCDANGFCGFECLVASLATGKNVMKEQKQNCVMGAEASMTALSAGNDFISSATEGLSLSSNVGTDGVSSFASMGGGNIRQETG